MTKQNKLPEDWQEKRIGEFAEVITGGTPSTAKKEYWDNGTVPWIPSGDLKDKPLRFAHVFITKEGLKNSAARIMPKKSVLIALTGATTGQTAILEFEASANQSVTGILPSKEHIPEYLYYYLRTIRNRILDLAYGGGQPHISQGFVKNLIIPLPPFATQKRIVQILEKAEQAKKKREDADKLTDEYLKSVFYEMFGDEKKFEEVKLGDVAKFCMGGTPASTEINSSQANIPWIKGSDLDREYIHHAENFITEKGMKNSRAKYYPSGTILIGRAGQGKTRATTAILKFKSTTNETMIAIFPNYEKILSEYIHFNLKSRYQELRDIGGENQRGGITQADLNKLEFPLPPLPLQQKFAKIVEHVEKLKEKQKKSQEQIENLFNSLMQKAFKGELVA